MTLYLTCAYYVITLPNERVAALFHHFFLHFYISLKSIEKLITPQLQDQLSVHFTNIGNFLFVSGRPRVGQSVNNKQKVRQAMVKNFRGGWEPPLGQMLAEMA